MAQTYEMCALRPGERARVSAVETRGAMRRRLMDLGLVPGAEVQSLFRAGEKGLAAYLIRGAVIALRRGDAGAVLVTKR